jgi:hypothetical protein
VRPLRADLQGDYAGHWLDFDPAVPFSLYRQVGLGDEDALPEFLRRAIVGWSLPLPLPREQGALTLLPWDLWRLVPIYYRIAHRLSDDEYNDVLRRVAAGRSEVPIPELDRYHLCERLKIPYASGFDALGAGETLRLMEALNLEDEMAQDRKKE